MIDHMKTLIVSQDNRISQTARAEKKSLSLTVYQKKFLLLLISRLNKDTTEFPLEEISFSDYCKIMNIPVGGNTNNLIKESILDLSNKNFMFETEPKHLEIFCWIEPSDTEIFEDKKIIKTRLGRKLQQYYLGLSEFFTSFQLGFTINFKSKYSYRIYEYLRSYANQQIIVIKVEDAYEILADNKYTILTDFERHVLKKALEEINDYSDITAEYTKIKHKNKTTHIAFRIMVKDENELDRIRATWKTEDVISINSINEQIAKAFPGCLPLPEEKNEKN